MAIRWNWSEKKSCQTADWQFENFLNSLLLVSAQTVLTENLGMKRRAVKFVLRLLSVEQKIHRVQMCPKFYDSAQSGPHFISKIIAAGDLVP